MFARYLLWMFAAVVGSWISTAQARTWNFQVGSAPLKAELIDLKGGIVSLLQPNGEVVRHHQSVLSDADRKFIDDWVSAEETSPPGDEIQVSATPYWETIQYVGNSSPPKLALVLLLKVRGKAAAAATCYSDLKIDDVAADDGTSLALSETVGDAHRPVPLDRYGKTEQPSWGFKFRLLLNSPEKPVAAIRRLSGSVKIVTGKPHAITIERVGVTKNRRLDDPLLRQAGLTATENPDPRSAGVFFEGQEKQIHFVLSVKGPRQNVFGVELLDAKGKLIDNFSGHSTSGGGWTDEVSGKKSESTTYQFDFFPPAPATPSMRLTVLEEAHEVQVPFEVVDVKIPPYKPRRDQPK